MSRVRLGPLSLVRKAGVWYIREGKRFFGKATPHEVNLWRRLRLAERQCAAWRSCAEMYAQRLPPAAPLTDR